MDPYTLNPKPLMVLIDPLKDTLKGTLIYTLYLGTWTLRVSYILPRGSTSGPELEDCSRSPPAYIPKPPRKGPTHRL